MGRPCGCRAEGSPRQAIAVKSRTHLASRILLYSTLLAVGVAWER